MDKNSSLDIHHLTPDEVIGRLDTNKRGLTETEARRRLSQFGPNVLARPDKGSLVRGIIRQFTHFLAVLLWIAGIASIVAINIAYIGRIKPPPSDRY